MNLLLDSVAIQNREADISSALNQVADVLREHRSFGGRWRKLTPAAHLGHAIMHIAAYFWWRAIGARTREPHLHLSHAATRVLMALQLDGERK